MSSDPLNAVPSSAPDPDDGSDLGLLSLVRARGAPLIDALEAHHPGSRERAEAASAYAFATAVELGLTRSTAELIRETAKLQDVGRVYIPAEVLAKPASSRTPEEGAQVDGQQERGAQLARGAGIPDRVCEWIRLGAERYDGGGPNGLAREAIPIQARISRAGYACYEALSEGAGPRGRDRDALDSLHASAGRELDPAVVAALETLLMRARTHA